MKTRGSALIIAMTIGLLLSGTVFSAAAIVSMRSQTSSQSIEGDIAYSAALSGIEDGLLRYKYAKANGKAEDAFGDFPENFLVNQDPTKDLVDVKYSLKIINESVGGAMDITKSKLAADETIDLNLSNLFQGIPTSTDSHVLTGLTITFTDPYPNPIDSSKPIDKAFTALNYRLVNADPSQEAKDQIISEKTNTVPGVTFMDVEGVAFCQRFTSCHLRIKPQVVSKSQAFNPDSKKLIGTGKDIPGKFIFYTVAATFAVNFDRPDAMIGTVKIVSVGKAGRTARKVEAVIDSSSGAYLGMFDFGIYCGKECEGT